METELQIIAKSVIAEDIQKETDNSRRNRRIRNAAIGVGAVGIGVPAAAIGTADALLRGSYKVSGRFQGIRTAMNDAKELKAKTGLDTGRPNPAFSRRELRAVLRQPEMMSLLSDIQATETARRGYKVPMRYIRAQAKSGVRAYDEYFDDKEKDRIKSKRQASADMKANAPKTDLSQVTNRSNVAGGVPVGDTRKPPKMPKGNLSRALRFIIRRGR